jgi:hypothetical protein
VVTTRMALRPTHPDHQPIAMDVRSAVFYGPVMHSCQQPAVRRMPSRHLEVDGWGGRSQGHSRCEEGAYTSGVDAS